MSDKYILVDGVPTLEPDLMKWAMWFETSGDDRIVARTEVKGYTVSTVFLALDHSFSGGVPILFESMIFGPDDEQSDDMRRYATIEEARVGHDALVEALMKRVGALLQ